MKKSKVLTAMVESHPDVYAEYKCDTDNQHWVYLTEDYVCEDMECRTICGNTVKEVLGRVRSVVKYDPILHEGW